MVLYKKKYSDIFIERECDDEFSPKIGTDHQAEIPLNLAASEDLYDKPLSSAICFPVSVTWSDADAESLVLALFLFGKNFTLVNIFLENKGMEEILSFYYGKFYNTDGYRRWSECRKLKGRKCIIAKKLSTKMRQNDLLSRLIPHVPTESQHNLLKVSKSYVEGKTCLEKYISSMASIVGLGIFAQALGIGKENGVLTRLDLESRKNSCGELSAPACNALSSLGPDDIIQSLTAELLLSKTRRNELFWEAVWPRLLARGWHSEQPKNLDYWVFLIPGVEKFSLGKHLKGLHYFDSVRDVLSKVVAEPNIILLEEEESNTDVFTNNHRSCYLRCRSSTYDKDHIRFVNGGKPSDIRELKYVSSNTVEVNVDGKRYKGYAYTRRVNHTKDLSESITQRSTKLSVIDTNRLHERKLLKVKPKRFLSIELEDASMMKENKVGTSTDNPPRMVEAKIQLYGRKKTNSCRDASCNGVSVKKEARDNPDNNANKIVERHKNQDTCVFDDSQRMRIIKHPFNWRVSLGDSNHEAVPTKRRRLTACTEAEIRRIIEIASGELGSDKAGFICSFASSADRSVEENVEKSSPNDSFQSNSEEGEQGLMSKGPCLTSAATEEVIEEPLRTHCDVGSLEQPKRRQSSRNSKLTVKAFESLANEFLHVQKKQKKIDIIFNPCRKARTRGKTRPRRHFLAHWNAVEVQEENHLNVDGSIVG
ncbi:uncharacterized protein LOC131615032 [Vicia villosa]|uniref:uncharacterized protein LOC131615032 n=1 Tax=Vicia villosa TaxID=3911 RepID=UPI00273C0210|nr:uncharacterized protein LOC131615032 [Vicia villosa]